MLKRTFVAVPAAIAIVAFVVGCAGPTASSAVRPAASALAPASELAGTWAGTFGEVAASYSMCEGICVIQIAEDDTFTAACKPNGRTNNVLKASTWSGRVVTRGNRVTFEFSQGGWLPLVRSGNTLYGVGNDFLAGRTIMIAFEREVGRQAEKAAGRHAGSRRP